jgi:hypothetical protein
MGEFFQDSETHRVEFPDGQWVDVKTELSQEDSDYITSRMTRTVTGEDGKSQKVVLSLGKLAMLERSIVAWSFSGEGKPVPITPENISRLRLKYRSKVLEEINRLNEEAAEFVSKNA